MGRGNDTDRMATVHPLPRVPVRGPFEDQRRVIAGGWDVEAFVVEDGLTVFDRIQQAAANHAGAEVIPFPTRPAE